MMRRFGPVQLYPADALEALRTIDRNTFDSLITDPPSGIDFMGNDWDENMGGRRQWIGWIVPMFAEALRVLKPGAHGLVWGLPRTSHWTATALELSGFEIRDCITHVFASGMPKSLNVAKAIDKQRGSSGRVVGSWKPTGTARPTKGGKGHSAKKTTAATGYDPDTEARIDITEPETAEARKWKGYGTGLKPASEHWWLVRKPLAYDIAENMQVFGTGALNIDGTRVRANESTKRVNKAEMGYQGGNLPSVYQTGSDAGRWPANFILSHAPTCERIGEKKIKAGDPLRFQKTSGGGFSESYGNQVVRTGDDEGNETIAVYECVEGCPIAGLDAQSGVSKSRASGYNFDRSNQDGVAKVTTNIKSGIHFEDSGGASRYFHCIEPEMPFMFSPKPSLREKEAGLSNARDNSEAVNRHPTVKCVALMRYLSRLATPRGGHILDMFAGSGTEFVAGIAEGFQVSGCEKEADYWPIIEGRVKHALKGLEARHGA